MFLCYAFTFIILCHVKYIFMTDIHVLTFFFDFERSKENCISIACFLFEQNYGILVHAHTPF